MIKKLLIAAVALVLLLVVGVMVLFFSIDAIAKAGIEKGGTYALGTQTTVSSVSVGVFKGEFSMSGLNVANPTGSFASPHFLSLGKGATAVSLSTLRQPTVEIPLLALDNLDVNLESKSGSTNYGAILDNLKKLSGDSSKPAPAPSSGGEKKFVIRQLTLTNINIHVDMGGSILPGAVGDVASKVTKVNIPLDKIELKDVGSGVDGGGVTMSQLTGLIVKAVLSAAADKGGGLIPTDMLGDLTGKLSSIASLDSLSKGGAAIVTGAADLGKKVGDGVGKTVEGATKGVGDTIKGVFGGGDKKK